MEYNQFDKGERERERETSRETRRREAEEERRVKERARETERRTFHRMDSRDDSPRLVKPSGDSDIEFIVTMETGLRAQRLCTLSLIPAVM